LIETGIEALVLDATDMFLQLVPHTSASEVSLDSYAARVCEVPAADSEPAVLVGHSMGGIVATKGAARCPERIAALVDTNKTLKRKANPSL
jgi:pimeloyl-ACP methyl ester carboxylesterase